MQGLAQAGRHRRPVDRPGDCAEILLFVHTAMLKFASTARKAEGVVRHVNRYFWGHVSLCMHFANFEPRVTFVIIASH